MLYVNLFSMKKPSEKRDKNKNAGKKTKKTFYFSTIFFLIFSRIQTGYFQKYTSKCLHSIKAA